MPPSAPPPLLTPAALPVATPSMSSRTAGCWLAGTAMAGVLGASSGVPGTGASPLLPARAPLSGASSDRRAGCLRAAAGLGVVGSRPEPVAARLAPAAADNGSRPEAALLV